MEALRREIVGNHTVMGLGSKAEPGHGFGTEQMRVTTRARKSASGKRRQIYGYSFKRRYRESLSNRYVPLESHFWVETPKRT